MTARFLSLVIGFYLVLLAPLTVKSANSPRQIDGKAIDRALHQLFQRLKDKPISAVELEEIREPDVPALADRYQTATLRLNQDYLVDSLLVRPELNVSIYIEEKTHLTAELWRVYFEQEGEKWKAKRFKVLLRANVGDVIEPSRKEVYSFDQLTIHRDSAEFHLTDGYLVPASVDGSVGRVAILGKGRFTFTAPNKVERHQLTKYTRQAGGPYVENFSQLVLLLSDEAYRDLIKNVSLKKVNNGRIFKTAEALLHRVEKDYLTDVGPTSRRWSFVPTNRDYLRAEFDRESSPNWLLYSFNPFEMEEISLIQKSGFPRNFKLKPPLVWCHFSKTQPVSGDTATVKETTSTALLNIQSYQIVGELKANKTTLSLRTRVAVTAQEDSVQTLTFMLNEGFRIRKVAYADDEGALLIKQGAFVSIPLLEPLRKNESTRLTFWYEGDVIHQIETSFFTPLRNEQWLPQHSNRDSFLFDMEMRTPKSITVITSGVKLLEYDEENAKISRWQALQPINLLGMAFSGHRTLSSKTQDIDVTLHTDKKLLINAAREKAILKEVAATLPFFSESFGEYPYKKLDIVQMPDNFEYGQGFPALLMLWGMYFRSDYALDRDLPANKFSNVQQFFKSFMAHELAHQWWGNVVVPKTYRDAWLSEGMATYAADLFIEKMIGKKEFVDMLRAHVRQAKSADREGSINLGARLNQHYQPLVYDKGAMVLHMLRQVCGDEQFFKILSSFYKSSFRRLITTDDFRHTTENVMGRDMSWFFDQWIKDTGYPVYRTTFTSRKRADLSYDLQCTVSQEQEGRVFAMPVPVRIELKNGTHIEQIIWNNQRYQTFEITVPDEVKRIETAPDFAVYCETAS